MDIEPVTHLEKTIAGTVEPVTHLEQVISEYGGGGGGGGGAVSSVNGKTGAVVLTAADVGALPNDTPIPAAVTEQTVSDWGFTKNTGTYSKPSGGIPKTDLASDVQTSLKKADTVHDGKDGNKTYICTNFDSAETYAVGDYVMYSSALYECTTAHTGAWNASHFTAVTLNEGDLICNTDENSSVAWSDITGKPTTLAGYGITDAEAKGKITINGTQKTASSHTLSWTDNGTTYSYEVVTV